MTVSSIADFAQSLTLRRHNANLRNNLIARSNELATGIRSDLARELGTDLSPLAGIERGLRRVESYATAASDFKLEIDARQNALGTVRQLIDGVVSALLLVESTSSLSQTIAVGQEAESRFDAIVSQLNVQIGQRSLFAGTATDGPALADADTMLQAIEDALMLAGVTTVAGVETAVDTWFAPGGDFDSVGYIGGPPAGSPLSLSENESVSPPIRADDLAIREALASLALAALAGRGTLSGELGGPGTLARRSGERLLSTDTRLVDLQADLGRSQSQAERAQAENEAAKAAFELARSELIGIDPYEAAVNLQAVEQQLIQLFTITGRLADLSLTRYLR